MRILIFLITIIATSFHCSGQQDAMVFKNLTTNMGLSHGDIISICQDHTGYMWIGTGDGLNKYDGIEFTVYKFNKKDSTTLNNSYINSVYEDRQNNLWIGTSSGLCKYNRERDNFERINYNDNYNNRFEKSVT
jgi:ligand-binding sensor domain-containing protein